VRKRLCLFRGETEKKALPISNEVRKRPCLFRPRRCGGEKRNTWTYFERSEKKALPISRRNREKGFAYFERSEKQGSERSEGSYFERSEKKALPISAVCLFHGLQFWLNKAWQIWSDCLLFHFLISYFLCLLISQ